MRPYDRALTLRLRWLMAACALVWIATAIKPHDPQVWLLEQVASLCCLGVLWGLTRWVALSFGSALLLAVLFACHAIGTHYTYSLTPYDAALESWLGVSLGDQLGWERNHYDRFVHWLFGAAVAGPLAHFCRAYFDCRPAVAWLLALNLVLSVSAVYELMEWSAALVFAERSSAAYLGSQGDPWDAQADMALAGLGALMAALVAALMAWANGWAGSSLRAGSRRHNAQSDSRSG